VWEGCETRRFQPTHQTLDLNETHPQEGRANDIPGLSDGQADCRKYMHMNLFHAATLEGPYALWGTRSTLLNEQRRRSDEIFQDSDPRQISEQKRTF
jgi:hypothetical protein